MCTTFPHYNRDDRLLLLHDKHLVDASVLHWVGGTQPDEGSRHMINVKPPDQLCNRAWSHGGFKSYTQWEA